MFEEEFSLFVTSLLPERDFYWMLIVREAKSRVLCTLQIDKQQLPLLHTDTVKSIEVTQA